MGELEANSLWVKYKTGVWQREEEQTYSVHTVVRAIRSIHNMGGLAYLSMPFTSGKVLYDTLDQDAPMMSTRLRKFLTSSASSSEKYEKWPRFKETIRKVIDKNYLLGMDFLQQLEDRLDMPILFPGALFPRGPKWSQEDFQALWLTLIGEKASEMHMAEDWQYSTGAVEEFTHAQQLRLGIPKGSAGTGDSPFYNTRENHETALARMRNIRTYDHTGREIPIEEGIASVQEAVAWIEGANFDTGRIGSALENLRWTKEMIDSGFYQGLN